MVHPFNPSTWETGTWISASLRLVYSAERVLGQPGIHRETLHPLNTPTSSPYTHHLLSYNSGAFGISIHYWVKWPFLSPLGRCLLVMCLTKSCLEMLMLLSSNRTSVVKMSCTVIQYTFIDCPLLVSRNWLSRSRRVWVNLTCYYCIVCVMGAFVWRSEDVFFKDKQAKFIEK